MELKEKIKKIEPLQSGKFQLITTKKYDEDYLEKLSKTYEKIKELHIHQKKFLENLKDVKLHYYEKPEFRNKHKEFSIKLHESIIMRNHMTNHIFDIYKELKETGYQDIDNLYLSLGYKSFEIVTLLSKIETELEQVMNLESEILNA